MAVAIATSLATIIPTTLSAVYAHAAKGNLDYTIIRRWAPFVVAGSLLGSSLIAWLRSDLFILAFVLVALFAAGRMLLRPGKVVAQQLPTVTKQRGFAFMVATVSAIAGIGGGSLIVPFLTAFNVKAHRAIGCSAVFGLLISLSSVLNLLLFAETPLDAPAGSFGLVNWLAVLAIVPLTVSIAPIGVRLGQQVPALLLKRIFGCCLLITSVRMLFQVLS